MRTCRNVECKYGMVETRKMQLPALTSIFLFIASAEAKRQLVQTQPPPVPIQDFTSGALRESYSTHFDGCGQQACACGIPPELLKDKQGATIFHVALNGILPSSAAAFKLAAASVPRR